MAKENLSLELEADDYDILEDIQPDDFVFVIDSRGTLKGISFPEDMQDDDEVDPTVEEIIDYLVKKHKEVRPAGVTLH